MGTTKGLRTAIVPITERALLQRINRKLRADGEMLKRTRGPGRAAAELGEYYALDLHRNATTAMHVDIEEWGRELGALRPWEHVKVSP